MSVRKNQPGCIDSFRDGSARIKRIENDMDLFIISDHLYTSPKNKVGCWSIHLDLRREKITHKGMNAA